MPQTIKEIVASTRDLLGNPDYGSLSNASILNRLFDKLDLMRSRYNLANQNWYLNRMYLTVPANENDIAINPDSWGRPVLVNTYDSSDTQHVAREIPITTVQDADLYYIGVKSGVNTSAYPHIAEAINFFTNYATGQLTARVTPQHSQSVTYEVWYQPDRPTPPALGDNFPLEEAFVNFIKTDTALDCLPMLLTDTNVARMGMLERRLESNKMEYRQVFDRYINQAHLEQAGPKIGFAENDGFPVW